MAALVADFGLFNNPPSIVSLLTALGTIVPKNSLGHPNTLFDDSPVLFPILGVQNHHATIVG